MVALLLFLRPPTRMAVVVLVNSNVGAVSFSCWTEILFHMDKHIRKLMMIYSLDQKNLKLWNNEQKEHPTTNLDRDYYVA